MPTNEQRRETAKRKLERQLERRAERARRRRQLTVALSAVGVVVLVGAVALVVVLTRSDKSSTNTAAGDSPAASSTSAAAPTTTAPPAPVPTARAKPLAAAVSCTYKPTPDQPASKKNTVPTGMDVSTQGTVAVTMTTSAGTIGLTLDRAKAPCTVHSFVNLAEQKYFDGTPCHRLTTEGIKVLQCGDPTGKGSGGPGYSFANEFPTDQYPPVKDPANQKSVTYPRGTIAMANAGPNTNGSQFFLVYGDSPLPPQYTVFGTIGEPGLKVIDAIAAKGIKKGSGQGQPGDGAPATPVTITTMTAKA